MKTTGNVLVLFGLTVLAFLIFCPLGQPGRAPAAPALIEVKVVAIHRQQSRFYDAESYTEVQGVGDHREYLMHGINGSVGSVFTVPPSSLSNP